MVALQRHGLRHESLYKEHRAEETEPLFDTLCQELHLGQILTAAAKYDNNKHRMSDV